MSHEKTFEEPQYPIEHKDRSQQPINGIREIGGEKKGQGAVGYPTEEQVRNKDFVGFVDQEFFETGISLEEQAWDEEKEGHEEIIDQMVERLDICDKITVVTDDDDDTDTFHQIDIFYTLFRSYLFHNA